MRKLTLITLALLLSMAARGQLRSAGEVPADLKMNVQELYESDLQRAKKYTGGRVKNKQQVLEASYHVNKMLAGGHIVYGDPVSRMLERIADTLLADYPELRSELRFYTVTSPEVNAFATGQGIVFVNAGLVAQVEDEAQLAFILGHEIVHYYRSHTLEKIVGKKKDRKNDKTRKADLEEASGETDDFIRYHNRSREMENEADSLGIAMFYLNSPYAKDVSEGVFDVLQYSALPFDDLPFDTTWFNTMWYSLNGCWLDTVASITSRDNYDDSRSTHPNIISRRRSCAAALSGRSGGRRFVVSSEEEFLRLRRMARIECIRQETIHGQYARALYNTWLMLPDSTLTPLERRHLDNMLAQQLYGLAKFKAHDKTKNVVGDYKEVEGESQQVHFAFNEMAAEHAVLAALHKVWELHRRYPDEKRYEQMASDLMDELRLSCGKSTTDFLAEPPSPESADTVTTASADQQRAMTKYERIKQKRETQMRRNPTSYALTDLQATDEGFAKALHAHLTGNIAKPSDTETASNDTSATIVFNPTCWIFGSKVDDMKVLRSDKREADLTKRITRTAEHFGHRAIDLSDAGMHNMENDQEYNDFLTLCEWSNEFWTTNGDFDMRRLMQSPMDDMLDRYGARTVEFNVLLNIEGLNPELGPGYIIILPLAPLVTVCMFTSTEYTAMASVIVDARDGKVLSRQAYNFNVADHNDMVDAMLYDSYASAMHPKKGDNKGFMGKRLALTGGFNLGAAGYQTFEKGRYVALTPWAALEFAITRKKGIAIWGRYNKGYDDITQSIQDYYPFYSSHTVQSSMDMLTIGLDLRNYMRSEFAPLGLYYNTGLHMVRFTNMAGVHVGNTFGAHIGLGRNYVFFHWLMLNYEVCYSYTYGLTKTIDHDFSGNYKNYMHYADAIATNLITMRLGIGLIPF